MVVVVHLPKSSQTMGENNYRALSTALEWSIQVGWDLKGPEEVVKNPFAECSVDFHEVCQTVEILFTWDPLWFLCFIRLLTGIVQAEEAAMHRVVQHEVSASHRMGALGWRDPHMITAAVPHG